MMRKLILILIAAGAAFQASAMTVTLTQNTLFGNPGNTVSFFGTLDNNSANTVFINGDSFTFAIPGVVDDTPFLTFAPIFLAPSQISAAFEFLNVTIPIAQGAGIYDGVITILGGDSESATDVIGSAAFHVNVNSIAPSTPEPGSLLLMAGGIAGLLWRRRRRG
jgi:hypothetical protein